MHNLQQARLVPVLSSSQVAGRLVLPNGTVNPNFVAAFAQGLCDELQPVSPQLFLLEDLFQSVTVQDVQQFASWLSTPQAYETGPLQASRRSVADRKTRYLMTKVNELPRNAEFLLHEDSGKANPQLWELAKRLRAMFVPHIILSCCSI